MGTVLLSGASGFIAQNTAQRLKKDGFRTIGVSHSSKSLTHFDAVFPGALTEPLDEVFREGIDVFIHCALHSGKDDFAINVEGTRLWADQAEKGGVKHQIFLSSVSARADSSSTYARAKHALEQWFLARNHTVVRLGLVLGKGGLFQRMAGLVKKYPLLPILDGGRSRVFVSGIRDVCRALALTVEPEEWILGKAWNIFQSETICLRELLDEIKKQLQTPCLFFPFPSDIAFALVRILEKIPFLKLGISSNNIIGMRQDISRGWDSDYSRFGLTDETLENLIAHSLL
jgi:nucleoside-diphosphate-sugar epimerase